MPRQDLGYVRSFLWLRVGIGALGITLPLILVFVDRLAFHGYPFFRDSISDYYYSGMREWFVGAMFASGAFLVAYKISEVSLDNTASIAAGICAWIIALCPTTRPSDHPRPPIPPLNPLQDRLGEDWTSRIHYGASAGFIIGLGVLTILFGYREGKLPPSPQKLSPRFWRWFHYACAAAMGAGGVWIAATGNSGIRVATLIGEWVCTWAWGLSWLLKGAEWDTLFGTPVPERRADVRAGP